MSDTITAELQGGVTLHINRGNGRTDHLMYKSNGKIFLSAEVTTCEIKDDGSIKTYGPDGEFQDLIYPKNKEESHRIKQAIDPEKTVINT